MADNQIETEFVWVVLCYVFLTILLVGTLYNFLLKFRAGNSFRIHFIKPFIIISMILKVLAITSMIVFPIFSFYVFTQFYVKKSTTLF